MRVESKVNLCMQQIDIDKEQWERRCYSQCEEAESVVVGSGEKTGTVRRPKRESREESAELNARQYRLQRKRKRESEWKRSVTI